MLQISETFTWIFARGNTGLFAKCAISQILMFGAYMYPSIGLQLVALLVVIGIILHDDAEDNLFLLITLMPLLSTIAMGHIGVAFVVYGAAICKLVIRFASKKMSYLGIFTILLISTIELVYDFPACGYGVFLNIFSAICYFLLALALLDWRVIDRKKVLGCLIYTCSFALGIAVIVSYADGMSLQYYATSGEYWTRFGQSENARALGGAMELPIYAMVLVSCCFVRLTAEKTSHLTLVLYAALMLVALYIASLTHSRNLILGLSVFVLACAIHAVYPKFHFQSAIIVVGIVAILIVALSSDGLAWIDGVVSTFQQRGGLYDSGRIESWRACATYMMDNLSALLFGSGSRNYILLGLDGGYAFSLSAHNLVIDGLMAWGVIGLGFFCAFLAAVFRDMKEGSRYDFVFFIPLLVWFAMNMTSGSFEDGYEYFFLISLMLIASSGGLHMRFTDSLAIVGGLRKHRYDTFE